MGSRDEYISAMKSAFVSLGTRLTLTWVASIIPIGWNPIVLKLINIFIEPLAKKLFLYLTNTSELGAFFLYIDTRVGSQSKGFEDAAFSNWRIQQNGTKEQKRAAEENLWKEFAPFARLTG